MKIFVWISLVTVATALLYAYRRSHRKAGGFEINHVTAFTLGFLFYWLLPLISGGNFVSDSMSGVADYFGGVPTGRLLGYEWSLFLLYVVFAAGDLLGGIPVLRKRPHLRRKHFQPNLWRIAWAVVLLFFLAMLIQHRGQLFASYSDADFLARGTIIAVTIVLFSVSLRMAIEGRWMPMGAYFLLAFASLAFGGRLYFVSSVLSVLALISHRRPIRGRVLVIGSLAAIAAMGAIGVIRMHSQASLFFVLLNVASESLNTSFSLFSYLSRNPIAWIHLPIYLAKDFANLVPTFIVGEKTWFDLTQAGFGISSPLGAMNSWVSFNVNFGLLGTAAVLFLFGYLMRRYERITVPYLMLTGFTAFTFFRDPFSVSIVKNMFEFSILIPFLMEQVSQVVAYTIATGKPGRMIAKSPLIEKRGSGGPSA